MPTLREITTKWGFDVDDSALKNMEQTQRSLRSGFLKLGAVATAALAAIVLPAASVQANIKDTLTLVEETGEAFAKLEKGMTDKALELSNKLGISASEVATGFYQVLSTGAKALSPRFNALAEIGLKMAKVVGLEPGIAIEKLNDTLGAFNLKATEAARVADVLFKGSILGATTVPQLTDAMKAAGPAAADFGIELEETVAILAILANKGLKGSEVGVGFAGILARLKKPTADVSAGLAKINVQLVDEKTGKFRKFTTIMRDMQEGLKKLTPAQQALVKTQIAGLNHAKVLTGITSGLNKENIKFEGTLNKAKNAIDRAFVIKMGAASQQFKLMIIRVTNLAAKLGAPLLEPITKVVKKVSELILKFTEMLDKDPELTDTIARWASFAAVVAIVASGLGVAVTTLKLFMITSKLAGSGLALSMGMFILLAAVLVILGKVIIDNREELEEFWRINKDTPILQIVSELIGWVFQVERLTDVYTGLRDIILEIPTILPEVGGFLVESVGDLFQGTKKKIFGESLLSNVNRTLTQGSLFPSVASLFAPPSALGINQTTTNNTGGPVTININGGDINEVEKVVRDVVNQDNRNTASDLGLF